LPPSTLRRRDLLLATGITLLLPRGALALPSAPRRLALRNAHTGESFAGPYSDGNGPLPDAMTDLAQFLRDFHVDKIGPVDVGMLNFLADVMEKSGQKSATVLSAYRTRQTNEWLRANSFGVAENSQHLYGRAVDVTFDRNLDGTEQAALAMSRGGVGWYPRSHFIHLDSGPARSWALEGAGFDGLLVSGKLAPLKPGEIPNRTERIARLRAMAKQEFDERKGE
jgi:uncharacterized protein YcbK (DUF882 family)